MVRKSKGLVRMEPRSHTSAQQHLRQHSSGSRQKIEWMICRVSAKARKEPVRLERSIPTVTIGSAIATGLHRSYVQPYQKEEISGRSRAPRLVELQLLNEGTKSHDAYGKSFRARRRGVLRTLFFLLPLTQGNTRSTRSKLPLSRGKDTLAYLIR